MTLQGVQVDPALHNATRSMSRCVQVREQSMVWRAQQKLCAMASHRFLCTLPGHSPAPFEVELPYILVCRSDVLRAAVSMAGSDPPTLQLPAWATCRFFDSWKSLVLGRTFKKAEISIEDAMAGLQVCASAVDTTRVLEVDVGPLAAAVHQLRHGCAL